MDEEPATRKGCLFILGLCIWDVSVRPLSRVRDKEPSPVADLGGKQALDSFQ